MRATQRSKAELAPSADAMSASIRRASCRARCRTSLFESCVTSTACHPSRAKEVCNGFSQASAPFQWP